MKGHSLKIQVFKEMLQECSGSPVLGLRAFTATVQSLVGEQRSCKRGQKKKKCYKFFFFLMEHFTNLGVILVQGPC